jgi:hypothetical protein
MNKLSLTESELKETMVKIYKEEQIKLLDEKWNKLSGIDRQFVLEFLKVIYPEKAMLVTESRWYNTVGDIVGIFDPTGVVDIVNGISYWRQGDKLFAILSWVSAVPYLGDLLAKPVVGVMKIGGSASKAFKAATIAGDATKMAKTAKMAGGPIAKLVEKVPSWGSKLIAMLRASVGRVPLLGTGLVKTVEEFVSIFGKASKEMKASTEITGKLMAKGEAALTKSEKELLATELKKQSSFRGFRDYKGEGQSFANKYISGGMGRLWGNRATRSLMRRTKWYLGLLDFLGVANFVGPDELEEKYGDLQGRVDEYEKTNQAQQYAQEDLGQGEVSPPPPPTSSTSSTSPQSSGGGGGGLDPVSALASLFGGGGGTASKVIGALI